MSSAFGLVALLLIAIDGEGIVARAESLELLGDGKAIPRVERDSNGKVVRLLPTNMRLSAEEFAEIGRLTDLRFLVLYKTNVTDGDLKLMRDLKHLEGLNLTSIDISDSSIDEIIPAEITKVTLSG